MKLRKLISGVAAASVAVAALATAASAELVTVDQNRIFFSGTGSWMPVVYSDGTFDAKDKDIIDYGIDLTKIATVEVTMKATDPDWFEGGFGGAIVLSSKSEANADHNWNGKEYWGCTDEALELETVDPAKPVVFEKVDEYTYKGVMTVDDTNCVYADAQLCQIAVQEWGGDMSPMAVTSMVLKDGDGNEMISFDANGNASIAPVKQETPASAEEEAAPAPKGLALADCFKDNTVFLVADDGSNAYCTSNDVDVTSIYGVRFNGKFNADEIADEAAWIGGGIGANSNSTGWASTEWGRVDKPITCDLENGTVEWLSDSPVFAADDAYAQLWLQVWGGTYEVESVEVLGKGGAVIATTAAQAGDVSGATDSTKGSPDTGVADVAVVAGLALVAGGAFIVAKKRK